jgi:hypothetical protein
VKRDLRGLPPADVAEILQELRSHVMDSLAGEVSEARVEQALCKLGEPQEIARFNLSMRVAGQSLARRSPLSIFRTIVRLAGLSMRGLVALIVSLIGYGFAASWLLVALVKPFAPGRVGLWYRTAPDGDFTLSLGGLTAGSGAHDILGWSAVPIGLAIGLACAYLTYRYDRSAIRRMAQPSGYAL